MKPITSITTTIKGPLIKHQVGPLTAFVGNNRTRKSAMLIAVQAAITGRTQFGKSPAALSALTDAPEGFIAHVDGDGYSAHLELAPSQKSPTRVLLGEIEQLTDAQLETCIPLYALRDLVGYGPAKMREALFARWYMESEELPIPSLVAVDVDRRKLWTDTLAEAPSGDIASKLSYASAQYRKLILHLGKTIKSRTEQLQAASKEHLALSKSARTEEYLDEQERLINQTHSQASVRANIEQLHKELANVQANLATNVTPFEPTDVSEEQRKLRDLTAKLESLEAIHTHAAARLQRAVALAETGSQLHSAGADTCPLCHNKALSSDMATHSKNLLSRVRESSAKDLAELETRRTEVRQLQAHIDMVLQSNARGVREAEERTRTSADMESRLRRALEMNQNLLDSVQITAPSMTDSQVREERRKLREAEVLSQNLARLSGELTGLELERTNAKIVADECKQLMQEILASIQGAVTSAVNAEITPSLGLSASLSLEGQDCYWELCDLHGTPRPMHLLSKAESVLLGLGIMLAWMKPAPLPIICLDDEDLAVLDADMRAKLFQMLQDLVSSGKITQVFIATTSAVGLTPEWTVIETTS